MDDGSRSTPLLAKPLRPHPKKQRPISKRRARAKRMAEQREMWLTDQLVRILHSRGGLPKTVSLSAVLECARKNKLIERELAAPAAWSDEARERRAVRLIRKFYRIP